MFIFWVTLALVTVALMILVLTAYLVLGSRSYRFLWLQVTSIGLTSAFLLTVVPQLGPEYHAERVTVVKASYRTFTNEINQNRQTLCDLHREDHHTTGVQHQTIIANEQLVQQQLTQLQH